MQFWYRFNVQRLGRFKDKLGGSEEILFVFAEKDTKLNQQLSPSCAKLVKLLTSTMSSTNFCRYFKPAKEEILLSFSDRRSNFF